MGFMTLGDFREELNLALGKKAQSSNRTLDRWINRAYIEVVTKIEYEDLIEQETFESVADQAMYELPADLESGLGRRYLGIISIADLSNKRRLLRMGLRNYHLRDREVTGVPKSWASRGRFIYLHPTPDDIFEYELYGLLEPDQLILEDQETVIPAAWDHAVQLLAQKNAFLTLGMKEDATINFQAAQRYIDEQLHDSEFASGTPAYGVELPQSWEDMTDMRSE